MYRAGTYREQILHAVRASRRDRGGARPGYRTKAAAAPPRSPSEEAAALADSVADDDESTGVGRPGPLPVQAVLPPSAGATPPTVTSYDDETTDLAYTCDVLRLLRHHQPGHPRTSGKLVWKVDWPMRWAFEEVDFEPAGLDHATPGSSYTVGQELVEHDLRLAGAVVRRPTPSSASPACRRCRRRRAACPPRRTRCGSSRRRSLRWLYVRRQPKQAFTIDFGPEVVRLYDEWDALGRKAADPGEARRRRCSPSSAPSATAAGRAADPARSSYRSGRCPRWPT